MRVCDGAGVRRSADLRVLLWLIEDVAVSGKGLWLRGLAEDLRDGDSDAWRRCDAVIVIDFETGERGAMMLGWKGFCSGFLGFRSGEVGKGSVRTIRGRTFEERVGRGFLKGSGLGLCWLMKVGFGGLARRKLAALRTGLPFGRLSPGGERGSVREARR